jgi:hypothetical protein
MSRFQQTINKQKMAAAQIRKLCFSKRSLEQVWPRKKNKQDKQQ